MRVLPLGMALIIAVFALVVAPGAGHAELCFTATIDGAQAGTGSAALGTGLFILSDDQTTLTYNIEWSGIASGETAAHIHSDVEGGGVVHPLGTPASPIIGTWTSVDASPLSAARVTDLLNSELYVNIHSITSPGGEIRGQIIPGPCLDVCFTSTIDGTQSGTGSPGIGSARLSLNHTQTELSYNIEWSGLLAGETAAHIHSDVEGGGVVHGLGTPVSPIVGAWSNTDVSALTPTRVQDLLNGDHYINVHSSLHPGGEIRGQIAATPCFEVCYEATIDGAQAGTGSSATGSGTFILNYLETELTVDVTFSGLGSPETAAHIHSDAQGGGVVRGLSLGSPKIDVWKSSDASPFSAARVAELKAGDLYVNIHSMTFPAGEIRGQMVDCPVTGIGDTPEAASTQLHQNRPNPFNPTTTISYATTERSSVSLRIYDVSGALVRTLVDGVQAARTDHTAVWDGRDLNGRQVASGIYFYRLVTGSFSATKKMVLLK